MSATIEQHPNYADALYQGTLKVALDKSDKGGALKVRIDTLRLRITSVLLEDLDNYHSKLYGDERVMHMVSYGVTKSLETVKARMTETWLKRWKENCPFSALAIYNNKTNEFIGHVMLRVVSKEVDGKKVIVPGITEIYYLIAKDHQKQGYGLEVASAVIYGLLPKLIQENFKLGGKPIQTVFGTARQDNIPSWKILGKLLKFDEEKEKYGAVRRFYSLDTNALMAKSPKF